MRIYELLWLLLLLFPVSVGPEALSPCPRGCSRDRQTLVCLDVTNKDLALLYACINSSPEITVVDLRSKLVCDCDLLYLTNHHVNKDLLVFAPVECPPSLPEKCGMGTAPSGSHNHNGEIEIAGKMFAVQEDGLQVHLNNHITTLVQKLNKINDPKKRLEYLSAVYLNTQNAIDRLNKGGVTKTKVELPKPQVDHHVTTSHTPTGNKDNPRIVTTSHTPTGNKDNPRIVTTSHTPTENKDNPRIVTTSHTPTENKDNPRKPQAVSGGKNASKDPKQVQVNAHLNVNPKNNSVNDNTVDRSQHSQHNQYHFKPYIVNTKKLIKSKSNQKPVSPTTSRPPATSTRAGPKSITTSKSATATEEAISELLAPLINFLKVGNFKTIEETKSPKYHIQKEQSGWEHLVTDKSVTNKPDAQEKKQYPYGFIANDHQMKMVIFGSIIIFIVFVIICVLVAMTTRRRKSSNKPSKGDLEVSSYWGDKTVWKKLKGTVQTEYSRRESEEEKPPSSVIFNSCDFPRTNLVNLKKTGGGAAVSGLTAAIPQQPIMKDGIPQAPPLKTGAAKVGKKERPPTQEVHTRLLYRSGLYPGISNDSLTVLDRARPSSMVLDKNVADQEKASTSGVARKKDATTQKKEDTGCSIVGLEYGHGSPKTSPRQAPTSAVASMKDATTQRNENSSYSIVRVESGSGSPEKSPRQDATPVSSDESVNLEKKLFLVNYGHKSGYAVSQDVKGTVKVYQPAKFTGDMVSGGTSLHMEDQKYVDVLNTRMSYADREKARIARKKRLMRVQMFTG